MEKFSYKLVEDIGKELYIRDLKILPLNVRDSLNLMWGRVSGGRYRPK